jgi:hypothetical protein
MPSMLRIKQCNHAVDVQNDPFLSLTTVVEFKYKNEA